jgi:hypothetical protein
MKKLLIGAIILIATNQSFAIDSSQVEAIVKECETTHICNCPRAKVQVPTSDDICGKWPTQESCGCTGRAYEAVFDKYSACMKSAEEEIEIFVKYNDLFYQCQRNQTKFGGNTYNQVPGAHQTYDPNGKTLIEQVQEERQRIQAERDAAERAQRPAMEEVGRQERRERLGLKDKEASETVQQRCLRKTKEYWASGPGFDESQCDPDSGEGCTAVYRTCMAYPDSSQWR